MRERLAYYQEQVIWYNYLGNLAAFFRLSALSNWLWGIADAADEEFWNIIYDRRV